MLIDSNSLKQLWADALLSAMHVQNRIKHISTKKTLFELWNGY